MDAQIRDGLLEEIAELDRRYRLVEQARLPGRGRNVAAQTHGYREFVRVAASTGKAIAELGGAGLAAARAEALDHIWAYSRRQRSWFGKLGASQVDHRSAAKTIVSRLQLPRQNWKYRLLKSKPRPVTQTVNNRRYVRIAMS